MENEFRRIEKLNNGIFPINFLENILKELDINAKLNSLIITYFKKKTQKSFIDFQNFKLVIIRFSEGYDNLLPFLFEIITFPKDSINKNDLFIIIKAIKSDLSSSKI